MKGEPTNIDERIAEAQPQLVRFVRRRAQGRLLRYETVEDLAQAITARALSGSAGFEGDDPVRFWAWLYKVALNHLDDRRAYWMALKRYAGSTARLALADSGDGVGEPAGNESGPATRAERREMLVVVARALAGLAERDRQLLELASQGASDAEIGVELGMAGESAGRAKRRALERLRAQWRRNGAR
ncbi:MAG: RNA polymerase sigma factor [bacterium]|nr:RNA polymerase sigma factor [bacterium]